MIHHKLKLLFIHIPKNAGTSIEREVFKDFDFSNKHSRTDLYGWDDALQLNLQHATLQDLMDVGLITSEMLDEFSTFAVIRNPYTRAVSGYNWLLRDLKINDSFENFLLQKGSFSESSLSKTGREVKDHFLTQSQFLKNERGIASIQLLRFENLQNDFESFCAKRKLPFTLNAYFKKSKKSKWSQAKLLSKTNRALIKEKYKEDFENFGYQTKFNLLKFLLG